MTKVKQAKALVFPIVGLLHVGETRLFRKAVLREDSLCICDVVMETSDDSVMDGDRY